MIKKILLFIVGSFVMFTPGCAHYNSSATGYYRYPPYYFHSYPYGYYYDGYLGHQFKENREYRHHREFGENRGFGRHYELGENPGYGEHHEFRRHEQFGESNGSGEHYDHPALRSG